MKPPPGMKLIDEKGRRLDGRAPNELRPIRIQAGVLKRADGSCYLEWGGNKVIAGVHGPREVHPRHDQDATRAIVRCRYSMAPFSVDDRKRPGPDRRSQEISKIMSEALTPTILTSMFPRTAIDVFCEVLEAEAGTRCAALTAASVALADAGIPMKGLVASCAAGKVDNTVVLDLRREEDNYGDTDLPVAIVPKTGEVVLLQMDGHMTDDEFDLALNYAIEACKQIHEMQKQALLDQYREAAEEKGKSEQAMSVEEAF
ncbi:MAG TPA: exosome complex exonuclease Rrp41 [Candidatus Thermoplasmatota archaeon]|nr:exosome complex exonuclease Rrp41 [Candidatus Thermoplasmatota archaeon]